MKSVLAAALALILGASAVAQSIPAFPGAEGYGGYAKGGRGGDVYFVTNLNSSGAGSLANGIATVPASGRTIVFAVSGYIPINNLRLSASKVTIAGQTAPGDGVGLRNSSFRISGDEVIVRHLRLRHGKAGSGGDCLNLDSGSLNCVLDHIALSFSTDENMSSFSSPPENMTLQWSLNAWGLESHSAGGLWDQNHATCHHTLWAHNHTRDPKSRSAGLLEWINNVTFDYDIGFIMGDSETPAAWKANVRNSYFICPPGNIRSYALSRASLDRNGQPNYTLHLDGCRWDRDGDTILDGTDAGYSMATGAYAQSLTAFANTGSIPVTMDDPTVAWKKIVSHAGPLRLDVNHPGPLRDEVDARLLANLVTQTPNHIARESDLAGISGSGFGTLASTAAPLDADKDGMPDHYETALGWNPAVQDHNTPLANAGGFVTGTTFFPPNTPAGAGALEQYTRLEEYLHFLAIPHGTAGKNTSGNPTSLVVDLAKFTSGFASSPSFAIANVVGGSVALNGAVATFTPTLNTSGRARFDFTVTDGAGHSWTQTCGIVVTLAAVPRDLVWKGAGNVWDGAALNWVRQPAGTTVAFAVGDRVGFDFSGGTQPTVTVTGANSPGSVDVETSASYTFAGTGAVTSTGELTKRGSGTLSLNNVGPNAFSAATLAAGTLALGYSTALGSAPLRIESGTFDIGGHAPTASALTIAGPATITGGSGSGGTGIGAVSGSAPLTILQTNVFDLRGDITGFGGTVTLAGNDLVRFNGSLGSATATFDLGTGSASLAKRTTGLTITLGALTGGAGTTLSGATGGSNTSATNYIIGATAVSTTFAGAISDGGGTTSITKTGAGTLTLTGASTHTGTTAVNVGKLAVEGSLSVSPVHVANAATLSGAGTLSGTVYVASGGIVEPGADGGAAAGTLATGVLTLAVPTLHFDLPGDHIAATAASLSGAQSFDFRLAGGTLSAGTYPLITTTGALSASSVTLSSNLVNTPRQTFALQRNSSGASPGFVQLVVTGNPATLTWTGATNATWDTAIANWTGATPNNFFALDAVIFDDSSTVNDLTIPVAVEPRSVTLNNATRAYTLGGSDPNVAAITGGALVKNGAGALTFTGTNAPTSVTIGADATITLANDYANRGALGSGPITFAGGTLVMHSDFTFSTTGNDDSTWQLVVSAGQTGTLFADSRCNLRGTLTGGGTFTLYAPADRTTLFGDWSAFTGTINVTTDANGGDFRIGTNYTPAGYGNATINLSANTSLYHSGILNSGAGTTIEIGALNGPSTSHLRGGVTAGRALTWRIGGKGTDATFSGDFTEQNTGTTTSLVKTGAGIWTLAGPCTHLGATTVEAGTLRLLSTASINNTAPVTVNPGATLSLQGGSITVDSVTIEAGATFTTTGGTVNGELNNQGTLTVNSGAFTVTGDVVNTGTVRVTSLAALDTTGAFMNEGILDLLTSASTLPANFTGSGVVILNSDRRILTATKSGANFACTTQGFAGHTYQLQRADSLHGTWTNIGGTQAGSGSVLTFTDVGGAVGAARFYRIGIQP